MGMRRLLRRKLTEYIKKEVKKIDQSGFVLGSVVRGGVFDRIIGETDVPPGHLCPEKTLAGIKSHSRTTRVWRMPRFGGMKRRYLAAW